MSEQPPPPPPSSPSPPPPLMPDAPPTQHDLAERDEFISFAAKSGPQVQSMAQSWRNGLATFIGLVTTGAILKGRDVTSDLTTGWRTAVTVLVGGGLLLAVVGLWQILDAEIGGVPKNLTLERIRADYGSLDGYRSKLALDARDGVISGRRTVAVAMAALVAGIAVTWWAPEPAPAHPSYIKVQRGDVVSCGTLLSADQETLRLRIAGAHAELAIPLTSVTNFSLVATCP